MRKLWLLALSLVFAASLAVTQPHAFAQYTRETGSVPELNVVQPAPAAEKLDLNTATADQTQGAAWYWRCVLGKNHRRPSLSHEA
jgi:hypothetical protein